MDRLEFICLGLNAIAEEPQDFLTEYMLAVAIRREIETVKQVTGQNVPSIDTYMIQTKAIPV
jgi:hypothetical protein